MAAKHVLVVDDDPTVLELVARALATLALRVSTARRVSIARSILARDAVDLILTDARMPGESGLNLAASTRDLGIPTIVMSGEPEWAAAHGLTAGHYLAKPFELTRLLSLVKAEIATAPSSAETD